VHGYARRNSVEGLARDTALPGRRADWGIGPPPSTGVRKGSLIERGRCDDYHRAEGLPVRPHERAHPVAKWVGGCA